MASQQIREDFEAAIANFVGMLQLKVDAAETFKNNAASSATTAGQKQIEVDNLFNQTVTKAAEAVASALQSYNWANKPEDQIVSGGEYSAYHHRRKAEIAAQQVLTALSGAVVFKGQWNASGNTFPTGASTGWMYRINGSGTLVFETAGTKLVSLGDYILKTDTGWTFIDEATDAVKSSRTINGKALDVDIVLTPADIQALAIADLATQAIAEAGVDDSKWMSSLKTKQALQKMGVGWTSAPPAIANIDAFDIPTGMYRTASGTTGTFPNANVANFTLIVTRVSSTAVNQILIYVDGNMWVRGSSSSVWGSWRAANASQHGVGGAMAQAPLDLNDARLGGFYVTDNAAAVNIPAGWPQARYSLIVAGSETYCTQIITNQSSTSGVDVCRMAVRRMRNLGTWSAWYEIWTSGNMVKQTSVTDATVGAMMLVGAFGLGGDSPDVDANTVNKTGFYRATANGPMAGTFHLYHSNRANNAQASQIAIRDTDNSSNMYFRIRNSTGTWTTWRELWHSLNLVKQTSATDNTAGSVLLTGAGGLVVGNALDAVAGSISADSLGLGTCYQYETTETAAAGFNLPLLGGAGTTSRHWIVFTHGIANRKVQEATEVFGLSTTKGRRFVRVFQDSTWSTWKYLWDTDNLIKQTSTTDGTAGRMLTVGAFGLGADAPTVTNLNTITRSGYYKCAGDAVGVPITCSGMIHHINADTTYATQIFICYGANIAANQNRIFVRHKDSTTAGEWEVWHELWTNNNLVKQTSAADTTTGSMMAVGAFGLGATGSNSINLTNVDSFSIPTGLYNCVTATTGTKPGGFTTNMTILVHQYDADQSSQMCIETTTGRVFTRVYALTAWTAWTEVWTSSNLVKQTSVTDNTAGRMLIVGAGGLLANAQTWGSANNADAINVTGFFRTNPNMANVPASVLDGSLIANYQRDANNQYQEIFERNSDARWYRRKFDGAWQSWVKMLHSGSPTTDQPELATKLDILSLQVALAI